jgi:hypothetical protein
MIFSRSQRDVDETEVYGFDSDLGVDGRFVRIDPAKSVDPKYKVFLYCIPKRSGFFANIQNLFKKDFTLELVYNGKTIGYPESCNLTSHHANTGYEDKIRNMQKIANELLGKCSPSLCQD